MDRVLTNREGRRRSRRWLGLSLLIASLVVLSALLLIAERRSYTATPFDTVVTRALPLSVSGRATTVPATITVISSESAGTVIEQRRVVGEYVKQGEVLFVLQNVALASDLADAHQQHELAIAEQQTTDATIVDDKLARQSDVLQSKNTWLTAEANANAEAELFHKGAISRLELERVNLKAKEAKTLYAYSQQRLQQFLIGQAAKSRAASTKVRLAHDRVQNLERRINGLQVRARKAGLLTKLEVKPGEYVQAGGAVAEIIGDRLIADIEIAQVDASRVTPGMGVTLSSSSGQVSGVVGSLLPRSTDGIVHLTAKLDQQPRWLRADMTLDAEIETEGGGPGLYVRADHGFLPNTTMQVVRRRRGEEAILLARFGARAGKYISVEQGLEAGDEVRIKREGR